MKYIDNKIQLELYHLQDFNSKFEIANVSPFISLVIENDEDYDSNKAMIFLEKLLDSGLVYLSTWGRNSEKIHDLADDIISDPRNENKYYKLCNSRDDLLITTWYTDEPLENALNDFLNNSFVAENYITDTKNISIFVFDNLEISNFIEEKLKSFGLVVEKKQW
jgi:hypothetical protein